MARGAAKRYNTSDDDEYRSYKHIRADSTATPRRSGRVVPAKSPADAVAIFTGPRKRKPKPTFHRFMDLPQELRDMVYDELWR
jgi:hypothetical protein